MAAIQAAIAHLPLLVTSLLRPTATTFDVVLLPTLRALAASTSWAVRRGVAEVLPAVLAALVGCAEGVVRRPAGPGGGMGAEDAAGSNLGYGPHASAPPGCSLQQPVSGSLETSRVAEVGAVVGVCRPVGVDGGIRPEAGQGAGEEGALGTDGITAQSAAQSARGTAGLARRASYVAAAARRLLQQAGGGCLSQGPAMGGPPVEGPGGQLGSGASGVALAHKAALQAAHKGSPSQAAGVWQQLGPPQQQEALEGQQEQQELGRMCEAVVHLLVEVLGTNDVSQWVRSAAIRAAGPALCALPRLVPSAFTVPTQPLSRVRLACLLCNPHHAPGFVYCHVSRLCVLQHALALCTATCLGFAYCRGASVQPAGVWRLSAAMSVPLQVNACPCPGGVPCFHKVLPSFHRARPITAACQRRTVTHS